MKAVNEKALDRLLSLVRPAAMPAGFETRLMRAAWALPQQKPLSATLMDVARDLLGGQGMKWRLAGAVAALLIGFSAGYFALPVSAAFSEGDGDLAGVYGIDQTQDVEAL